MLRVRGSILVPLALAVALVPAATAPAATTAQRFADAFERGASAMDAREADFRAALAAIDIDRCTRLLFEGPEPPARQAGRFEGALVGAINAPLYRIAAPMLAQLVADLDAIRTRDPALRSARAVWRRIARLSARVPAHDRPCERLDAWARGGFVAGERPAIEVRTLGELIDAFEAESVRDKLDRATRRLRRLGVGPGDAARLDGERLFETPHVPLVEAFARARLRSDEEG